MERDSFDIRRRTAAASSQQGRQDPAREFLAIFSVVVMLLIYPSPVSAQTQLSPSGTIATRTPTFTWTALAGAQYYALWVDDDKEEGRINMGLITPDAAGCAGGSGTCSVSPGVALAPGRAYWQLGVKTNVINSWSGAVTFTVPNDVTPPVVTITGPTTAASYTSLTGSIALSGSATDNVGVATVSWTSDRGGGGIASGTTAWTTVVALQSGLNVVTVTASDAVNNRATDTLAISYFPDDTVPPTVTITGPTSSATYTTSSQTLTLSGTSSDNVGVTAVTWTSDRGVSGTAYGTTTWSASVPLESGANVLTVAARDGSGNVSIDTISVDYVPALAPVPYPAGSIDTMTPVFRWKPVAGAQYYSLWVDDDHEEGTIDWGIITPEVAGCAGGSGVCSVSPGVLLAPGRAYWTLGVKTAGGHAWGTWVEFRVPDPTAPCLSLSPSSQRHSADPQVGFIAVTTIGGCSWNATALAPWILITPGWTSGTGDGQARYELLGNATGATREADIVIGPRSYHVTQLAGTTCGATLSAHGDVYDPSAHVEAVQLYIGSACPWTAISNVSWVVLRSDSRLGTGPATLRWDVTANTSGVGRSGTLLVAGQVYVVSQSGTAIGDPCSATVSSSALAVPATGGTYSVAVGAPDGCAWSAFATNAFVEVLGGQHGVGAGTVTFTVQDNPSADPRTAVLDVAAHRVEIAQAGVAGGPCHYETSVAGPLSADASTASIAVIAPTSCAWTAESLSDFVSISGGPSGSGTGILTLALTANTGHEPRLGALAVAGLEVGLLQLGVAGEPLCVTAVTPETVSVPALGTGGVVTVSASPECVWSIQSGVPWVTVSGDTHTGPGTFSFVIGINGGSARAVSFVVGSAAVTIEQDGALPTGVDVLDILWPGPESQKADNCLGNCGKGCGTFLAVCGTNGGNWTMETVGDAQRLDDTFEEFCSDGHLLMGVYPTYAATIRWTYHGVEPHSCLAHDSLCRSWLGGVPVLGTLVCGASVVGPYSYTICEDARPWTWSYEEPAVGRARFPTAIIENPAAPSCGP